MQFVGHISNQKDTDFVRVRDRRPLHDFYVRRYYNVMYGIESISCGLAAWVAKTLLENIMRTRFYRVSPWLELMVATVVYHSKPLPQRSDYQEIILGSQEASRSLYLKEYTKKFKYNSQFYH